MAKNKSNQIVWAEAVAGREIVSRWEWQDERKNERGQSHWEVCQEQAQALANERKQEIVLYLGVNEWRHALVTFQPES